MTRATSSIAPLALQGIAASWRNSSRVKWFSTEKDHLFERMRGLAQDTSRELDHLHKVRSRIFY